MTSCDVKGVIRGGGSGGGVGLETGWCLNRHLCILPEHFAKKDLNLVIVCRKDITS